MKEEDNKLSLYFWLGSSIVIVILLIYFILRKNPMFIAKHIYKHPESTSLYVSLNNEPIITHEPNTMRPLASTMKIMIAIEYALQVEKELIDKEQFINLDDVNNHYYEGTDGGAHKSWLEEVRNKGKVIENNVTIHELVKGMIKHSSNANTDYLIHVLGQHNINQTIKELNLTQHEEIYPIVGALLIPSYLKTNGVIKNQLHKKLKSMSFEEYKSLAEKIHQELLQGHKIEITELSMDVQRIWSDRLPKGSAKNYAEVMGLISNEAFSTSATELLRDILEWPMEYNENNKKYYTHVGMKGGSTAFVITQALYAETKKGDKLEIVLLIDNLRMMQLLFIGKNLNSLFVSLI